MEQLLMELLTKCLLVIVTVCATYITKQVVTWLEQKKLLDQAKEAIGYAEQLCKNGEITLEERKIKAIEYLYGKGIKIPVDVADKLIEAALGGINIGLGKTATTKYLEGNVEELKTIQ